MKRTAFITGATSGIGEACAILLASNGYNLVLCGRNQPKLDQLKDKLSQHVDVHTLCFDIGHTDQLKEITKKLPEAFQRIDVLINNAGGAHGLDELDHSSISDIDQMIDVNVKGLLYITRMVIPFLMRSKGGHVVNISSVAGKQPYGKGVAYCASKAAVEAISESLRQELVPRGIKVTNIAPGAVNTNFSTTRFKGDTERAARVYQGFSPLVAEDIAETVLFCLNRPSRVQISDMTILASAQSTATTIHRADL